MLDSTLIKTLNSKNISNNPSVTKQRLDEMWGTSSKQQKEKAVKLGGYTDTRSFNKSRTSGLISVRMAITLALTLNVDPFYIIACIDDKSECSMDKIKAFLNQFGYGEVLEKKIYGPRKHEIMAFIDNLLEGLNSETVNTIENLSNDELEILLKSYLIRAKIDNEGIRLFLIKLLLTRG
ncbi:hypothetical protein [uncultured Clostridium sp.]|jgi:hypothetical protein|uniref:hypothetical protein n=1 Tax=uncultured Clostridium sp. TaxID=59620 RepID=UPI0025E9FD62|nr:hypothetical protein [uncultured Clostridium sp.]